MALDAQACSVRRRRRSVDRLDVCTERIALVLRPDSVFAIARHLGKPAAAWTGNHAAILYRLLVRDQEFYFSSKYPPASATATQSEPRGRFGTKRHLTHPYTDLVSARGRQTR